MGSVQFSKAIGDLIAIPLIILIGLYMVASAIAPFLNLNNQTFSLIFTLATGVPALIFFFKKKIRKPQTKLKE